MNRLTDLINDDSFSDEAILRELAMNEEAMLLEGGLPCVLVMNKVDLVTNKRKMKSLQAELNDLLRFDEVFHVSCETGFGVEAFK